MNKCPKCGRETTWVDGTTEARYAIGDLLRFTKEVPARICTRCRNAVVSLEAMQAVERSAAIWVAMNAPPHPALFRFLRKAIGLPAKELASLLGNDPAVVSRWENGVHRLDAATWSTLATIVLDTFAGRTDTKDRLRAMRDPERKIANTVRLDSSAHA